MATTQRQLPEELRQLYEDNPEYVEFTVEQLRMLIEFEAEGLGLTFDEAIELGRRNELPKTFEGFSLHGHVFLWAE